MAVGIDVTGWSEEGILEAVRNEIGKNLVSALVSEIVRFLSTYLLTEQDRGRTIKA